MHNNGTIKTPYNVLVVPFHKHSSNSTFILIKFQPLPTKHTTTHKHVTLFIYKCTHVQARAQTLLTQPRVL